MGMEIILAVPDGTPGDVGQGEARFSPFGDSEEDINPDTGMATPTEPAQTPPGPLTRARAHELNFMMILKNEGPKVS